MHCHLNNSFIFWAIFGRKIFFLTITSRELMYVTTKCTPFLLLFFWLLSLILNSFFLISESIGFLEYSFFTNHEPIFSLLYSNSLLLENNLLMWKVCRKLTRLLVCFAWVDEKWIYWLRSVGFTCKSVTVFPSCNPIFR